MFPFGLEEVFSAATGPVVVVFLLQWHLVSIHHEGG